MQQGYGPDSSGLHVAIRNVCKLHDGFLETLNGVDAILEKRFADGVTSPCNIGVYCQWGKHRSVSMAGEIRTRAESKCFTAKVLHLERPIWERSWRRKFRWQDPHAAIGFPYPFTQDMLTRFDWSQPVQKLDMAQFIRVR